MDTGDLVEAVRTHRVVELWYRRGEARTVHPHAIYRTASGALRVDGFQVDGASSSGVLPGWRDFELMKITDVRVLDVEFTPEPDFDRASSKYSHGLIASVYSR